MALTIDRRTVLKSCALGATSLTVTLPAYPQVRKICISTYIYKKTDGLEIKADVYRAGGEEARPVIIWIHGGALIMGSRQWIDGRVKDMMLDAGYVIVSIDYRLAPETKLPFIIEDIEDAYTWVYKNGLKLFHADTSRIAVMGCCRSPENAVFWSSSGGPEGFGRWFDGSVGIPRCQEPIFCAAALYHNSVALWKGDPSR